MTSLFRAFLFVLIVAGNFQFSFSAWSSADEKSVRATILDTTTYDRLVRPTETVPVKAGLTLHTIDTLDIKSMTHTMTGWLTVDWTDTRLTWSSPADIEHFYALDSEIWKPELFIDNSKESLQILNDPYLQFKVDKTGVVEWELPMIFQTHCEVDVTYYPFDKQTCVVEVTSWAYTKNEITLTPLYSEVNTDDLQPHGEWTIVESTVTTRDITETKASGSLKTYPVIDFEIKLRRKPDYYITGVILPIIFVAYLQILVFILPVDSGEKIGFAITILLALAVLLTLVTDSMPSSSIHVSCLAIYLALTLGLGVFCVIGTVIVIKIHHRNDNTEVPKWVRKMMIRFCVPVSCWKGCCCNSRSGGSKITPEKDDLYSNFGKDDILSWKDVSVILDWFFFVVLLIMTTVLTLAVALALGIGAYTS